MPKPPIEGVEALVRHALHVVHLLIQGADAAAQGVDSLGNILQRSLLTNQSFPDRL